MTGRSPQRSLFIALALALLWAAVYRFLTLEDLLLRYDAARAMADRQPGLAAVGYWLSYVALIAVGLPFAFIMTWVGAALFGTAIGGGIALLGATTGATILFLLARTALRPYFNHWISRWTGLLHQEFHADAASYLLFARFTPVFPFVVTNVAAALLGARLTTFIWTTFLGIIPGTFAYAAIGSGLDHIFRAEGQRLAQCQQSGHLPCSLSLDLTAFISPQILMGLAGLATVMLISILARRFWRRGSRVSSGEGRKG